MSCARALEERHRRRRVAAPGGEHGLGQHQRCGSGGLRDRRRLVHQRRRRAVLAAVHVGTCQVGRGDGQHVERAGLARQPHGAVRQLAPRLDVPQVGGRAACQPQPAIDLAVAAVVAAERLQRRAQRRGRRPTKPSTTRVASPSSSRSSGRGEGGAGAPRTISSTVAPVDDVAGVERGAQRLEARLRVPAAASSGTRPLAASSSSAATSLPRRTVNATSARSPAHQRPLQVVERHQRSGVQQRVRRIGRPGLQLGLRRSERPLRPPVRHRRQLGRPLQERGCRRDARHAAGRAPPIAPDRPRPTRRAPARRTRDARRDGPGPPRDPWPRRAPGACAAGHRRPLPGTPPNAPAGDGTARAGRPRRAPRLPGRRAASAPIPSCSAARHSRVTSPSGSAAASSSSCCDVALSEANRRRKLCSICGESDPASGTPEAAGQLRRRQTARQLQQRQRVAAALGHDAVAHPLVDPPLHGPARAAVGRRRRRGRRRAAPADRRSPRHRSARAPRRSSPMRSASSRRATKESACAEARSSHCASSTRHTSGCSSAASASRVSVASATRNGSGAPPSLQAERDPQRLGLRRRQATPGRPAAARRAGAGPANGSSISDCTPPVRATRQPSAFPATYSSSADLPTPASPRSTSTALWPAAHLPQLPIEGLALARAAVQDHQRHRPRDGARHDRPGPPNRHLPDGLYRPPGGH